LPLPEKQGVGSSILPLATMIYKKLNKKIVDQTSGKDFYFIKNISE